MADNVIQLLVKNLLTWGPALKKMTPREITVTMLGNVASRAGIAIDPTALSTIQGLIVDSGGKNMFQLLQDESFVKKLSDVVSNSESQVDVSEHKPLELFIQCPRCTFGFVKTIGEV